MPSTNAPSGIRRPWFKSAPPALLACGISLLLMVLLVGSMAGYSSAPAQAQPGQETPATPTPIIGAPCGRTERLSDWAFCLHGAVLDQNGAPLNGIAVTASTDEGNVSGITSVHPGQRVISPSYGLDIAVITPTFLGPVIITATDGSASVTREILALPNWYNHNQRFDLRLAEQRPANLQLFGYVYDYTTGEIAAGALVTVESAGGKVTSATTAKIDAFDPNPVYIFDQGALGVTETTAFTVTASYNGMTFGAVTDVEPGAAKQTNLVVGWPCVNDEGLGRGGGKGFGLPRGGGRGFGLPDESCIWGVVTVDDQQPAGVAVYITTADGETHQGVTGLRPGEATPSYAIIVPNANQLIGKPFSVAATFSGFARVVTQTLSDAPAQRVDVQYATIAAVGDIGQGRQVNARWADPYLWLLPNATTGSQLVRITPVDAANGIISDSQASLVYTSVHGLPAQNLARVSQDKLGRLWFWGRGLSIYAPELDPRSLDPNAGANLGAWLTLDPNDELAPGISCCELTFDSQGGAWVTTNGAGATYVRPGIDLATSTLTATTSRQYTWLTDGLAAGAVISVLLDSQENAWLPATGGVSRIELTTSRVLSVTAGQLGFVTNTLDSVNTKLSQDDNLWVRAADGSAISRISPDLNVVTIYPGCLPAITIIPDATPTIAVTPDATPTISNRAEYLCVPSSQVTDILLGLNNSAWLVLSSGFDKIAIGHVSSSLAVTRLTSSLGLQPQNFDHVEVDNRGNLWIGTNAMLVRVDATTFAVKSYSATQLGLSRIGAIDDLDSRGNVWLFDSEKLVRIDGSSLDTITSYPGASLWPEGYGDGPSRQFDRAGNLWIHAWYGRVSFIDAQSLALTVFGTEQLGLEGRVNSAVIDESGNTTILANCDGRVSQWQPTTRTWRVMTVSQPNSSDGGCFLTTAGSPYLWYERDRMSRDNGYYYYGIFEQAVERPKDVSVQLSAPRSAVANREITYTLVVSNISESWVQPTLALTLPAGSQLISSSLPVMGQTPPFYPTGPVLWALKPLTPEIGAITVTAGVVMPATPGTAVFVTTSVNADVDESVQINNVAAWRATLAEPRPNLRVAVVGPAFITDDQPAAYTIWVDNAGGDSVPAGGQLLIDGLPPLTLPELGGINSSTNVFSLTQVLAPPLQSDGYAAVNVAVQAPQGTLESETGDNQAQAVTPSRPDLLDTLFIVAGNRMAQHRSHGASGVLASLSQLVRDSQVRGAILDVERARPVAAAYAAWQAANEPLTDTELANAVAAAIRTEIKGFVAAYPNIRYLIFIGGDDIIPFYRVADASDTHWKESAFARDLPDGTVRSALNGNFYLTDDYYTDDTAYVPSSKLWRDRQRPLYMPDRVSSRLVETPAEIQAAIAVFLTTTDRTIAVNLNTAILGGDQKLTLDTIGRICQVASATPAGLYCTGDEAAFAKVFTSTTWTTAWTAFHANQLVNGAVDAAELFNSQMRFDRRLWVSIGCHSGLNIPAAGGDPGEQDLIQAFVGQGGVAVAPTAYGYASRKGEPSYSESYMLKLGMRMAACSGQTVGAAFIQAKHDFFAEHEGWMDALDEKALLPITLYGLPHWQVVNGSQTTCPLPDDAAPSAATAGTGQAAAAGLNAATVVTTAVVTFTADPALFQPNTPLPTGSYYRYAGQTLAQDRRPIQPVHHLPVAPELADGAWPHGVMLLGAHYRDLLDFDPVIEQAWIISELQQEQPDEEEVEPPVALSGWDHDHPHSLGYYPKLAGADDSNPVARINLVLGACNAAGAEAPGSPGAAVRCRPERLFDNLSLGVLYSASDDSITPVLTDLHAYITTGFAFVTFAAAEPLQAASVVCDDGQGRYVAASVWGHHGVWSGKCPFQAQRVFVQAADEAGNVTTSDWQTPEAWVPAAFVFLGNVINNYQPPLPDLIVTDVHADQTGKIVATIQNIGRGWVTDDFWVDLCFMNSSQSPAGPPRQYNDVCKGRSYDYLVWAVAATRTPIPPGGTLVLGQDQADLEESVFERMIPAGTPIYVHVDSNNVNTSFGGVLEEHEQLNQPYVNNIAGPMMLPVNLQPPGWAAVSGSAARSGFLPLRVNPAPLGR